MDCDYYSKDRQQYFSQSQNNSISRAEDRKIEHLPQNKLIKQQSREVNHIDPIHLQKKNESHIFNLENRQEQRKLKIEEDWSKFESNRNADELKEMGFDEKWIHYFLNMNKEQFESMYEACENIFPLLKYKNKYEYECKSPFDSLYVTSMDASCYDQYVNIGWENDPHYFDFKNKCRENMEPKLDNKEKVILPSLCKNLLQNPEYLPFHLTKDVPKVSQNLNKNSNEFCKNNIHHSNNLKDSKFNNTNIRFLIPNFPPTFYYHAYIEDLKRCRKFPQKCYKKTDGKLLDNLRDPPCLPTDIFYRDREFRSRDDLVKTLRIYKTFGYSLIIEKSELKKGRFKLLCDRESKSKRQLTTGDKIGAECNRCNAYVNIYQLKVKSLKLEHSHPPSFLGKRVGGPGSSEPWSADFTFDPRSHHFQPPSLPYTPLPYCSNPVPMAPKPLPIYQKPYHFEESKAPVKHHFPIILPLKPRLLNHDVQEVADPIIQDNINLILQQEPEVPIVNSVIDFEPEIKEEISDPPKEITLSQKSIGTSLFASQAIGFEMKEEDLFCTQGIKSSQGTCMFGRREERSEFAMF